MTVTRRVNISNPDVITQSRAPSLSLCLHLSAPSTERILADHERGAADRDYAWHSRSVRRCSTASSLSPELFVAGGGANVSHVGAEAYDPSGVRGASGRVPRQRTVGQGDAHAENIA